MGRPWKWIWITKRFVCDLFGGMFLCFQTGPPMHDAFWPFRLFFGLCLLKFLHKSTIMTNPSKPYRLKNEAFSFWRLWKFWLKFLSTPWSKAKKTPRGYACVDLARAFGPPAYGNAPGRRITEWIVESIMYVYIDTCIQILCIFYYTYNLMYTYVHDIILICEIWCMIYLT